MRWRRVGTAKRSQGSLGLVAHCFFQGCGVSKGFEPVTFYPHMAHGCVVSVTLDLVLDRGRLRGLWDPNKLSALACSWLEQKASLRPRDISHCSFLPESCEHDGSLSNESRASKSSPAFALPAVMAQSK